MSIYIIAGICLYIASYAFYVTFSHGLGHKAEYLQLRRFIPCAILAVLPTACANITLSSPLIVSSFIVGLSWIITYPYYLDSVAYTDYILQQITEYAQKNLNLQALLYFSDHGVTPDQRRSPNFNGFAAVRIPMFCYFSEEYKSLYPQTFETLKNHSDYYWTNDLAYELICGILNITSNHYDESNSLASPKYKFTKETLKTDLGKRYLKDDPN